MRVLLSEKIKLEPKYLSKGFKNDIYKKLAAKIEGVCTKHGYTKKGSIEIFKIAPGVIDITSLNGYIVFNVHFYAEVCNPTLGSVVKAKVSNMNKFGILAESGYFDEDFKDNVNILEIIVAKNSINIQSEIELESIELGQEVLVEILGKRYELGDKKISVVGRIVSDPKSAKIYKKAIPLAIEDKDHEEDVEEPDVEDAAEDEAEEEDEEEGDGEEEDEEEGDGDEEEEEGEGDEGLEEPDVDDKSSKGGADIFSDEEDMFFEDDEYDEMFDEDNENDGDDEYD